MTCLLEQSLRNAQLIKFEDYDYVVHPLTDGTSEIGADLLSEITDEMVKVMNLDCDLIVTPEAMGIPIATAVCMKTGLPFVVVRKRRYGLQGEIEFIQRTGYSTSKMYINGVKKGDRVVIIDDIISTGGTLKGMITALTDMGAEIVDVFVIVSKGEGRKMIDEEFGINVKCLVKIDVIDGEIKLLES